MGFSEEASIFAAGAKASAAAIKQQDFSGTKTGLRGKLTFQPAEEGAPKPERARTILINALRSRGNSKREGRKGSRLRNAFLQSAMDLLERTNVTREAENILHKPFLLSIHRGSLSVSGSSRQLSFFPDCLLLWQDREGLSLKAHQLIVETYLRLSQSGPLYTKQIKQKASTSQTWIRQTLFKYNPQWEKTSLITAALVIVSNNARVGTEQIIL